MPKNKPQINDEALRCCARSTYAPGQANSRQNQSYEVSLLHTPAHTLYMVRRLAFPAPPPPVVWSGRGGGGGAGVCGNGRGPLELPLNVARAPVLINLNLYI